MQVTFFRSKPGTIVMTSLETKQLPSTSTLLPMIVPLLQVLVTFVLLVTVNRWCVTMMLLFLLGQSKTLPFHTVLPSPTTIHSYTIVDPDLKICNSWFSPAKPKDLNNTIAISSCQF